MILEQERVKAKEMSRAKISDKKFEYPPSWCDIVEEIKKRSIEKNRCAKRYSGKLLRATLTNEVLIDKGVSIQPEKIGLSPKPNKH